VLREGRSRFDHKWAVAEVRGKWYVASKSIPELPHWNVPVSMVEGDFGVRRRMGLSPCGRDLANANQKACVFDKSCKRRAVSWLLPNKRRARDAWGRQSLMQLR
jgi:hypothetical protein